MSQGGLLDKVKGRIREAAGSLLDDDEMKRKGRVEQTAGDAKEKAEEVVDAAVEKVPGQKES